jgi:hypothetical protein
MRILASLIAVIVVALVAPSACLAEPYVLPVADGTGRSVSPPCLEGQIIRVASNEIVVATAARHGSGASEVSVQTTPKTEMFTVYGGYVAAADLVVGQRVRIWFPTPDSKQRVAAVVMLASKNPSDDWPR